MSKIPLDIIKEKAPLADYIGRYYPQIIIRRNGSVHVACCPFHREDTPSFTMFANGTYHCYGCGAHGDIINFVQEMEHLDFKEACRMVADNVGVDYAVEPVNQYHEAYKNMMDEHTRRYWKVLQLNPDALNYLRNERGLTDQTIVDFRIGLVPQDEYKYRTDMGGLAGRISFPIMEHKDHKSAKCVGMGYRALNGNVAKYINDVNQEGRPATDKRPAQDPKLSGVFIKGNLLYGYSRAHAAIRKLNYAIVTEGYIDVVSMHQAEICNTVAAMGTGFTEQQMDALRKLTANLVLFMDSDSAGIANMLKALPMLYAKGFNVMIVVAEGGLDPADVCKKFKFNKDEIVSYIVKHRKPAMNVVIDKAVSEYEAMVSKERLKAMSLISPILNSIPDEASRDIFKNMAYKRLDIMG